MSFNTALSGLQAANADLQVTGNNIANASTTGFKSSRAEFGDVYAVSVLGSGSNAIGSGVLLADVAQQFTQGTVSFTDKSLDLAINGNGFFVTSKAGEEVYTRSGQFGVDAGGYVVANNGARLQGNPVRNDQIVDGVLADMRINATTQDPRQTSGVDVTFNLDANEAVISERIRVASSQNVYDAATNPTGPVARPNPGSTNGYPQSSFVLENASTGDTITVNIPSADDLPASNIANELNNASSLRGIVVATASTSAQVQLPLGFNASGGISGNTFLINGNPITGTTAAEVATAINNIPGFSVSFDASSTADPPPPIVITEQNGRDLTFAVSGATTVDVRGIAIDSVTGVQTTTSALTLTAAGTSTSTVGGQVNLRIDDPYQIQNASATTTSVALAGTDPIFTSSVAQAFSQSNPFDPGDQDTYNHATSTTIYDSFGRPHIMTQYFVKEPVTAGLTNVWTMYVQVDGNDVGPDDFTTNEPGRAAYRLRFNEDGTLDTVSSELPIVVNNWDASILDTSSEPLQPDNTQTVPFPDPPTSSNFLIDIVGSTQFGGQFAVTDLSQDGYGIGQLTRIEVADTGVVQARFTNGQTQQLGRVVLASFTNPQGLTPLGDTSWGQSFESGAPIIGQAQTGNLGAIQSGALEDSNVDLSAELVNLIIAQRNFQANAKTIETQNSVTQTIINLR